MTEAAIALPPGWSGLGFFRTGWPALRERLAAETAPVQPAPDAMFRALTLCPPEAARVVILGQDPYPTAGNADGLAFSVPEGKRLPASLRNIFREMEDDIGCAPRSGDLSHWARQGVLLLNTALTVPVGRANGHARIGWSPLIAEVLREAAARRPLVFILWGGPAQKLAAATVALEGHHVLASPHPSPLSSYRGFFGSRPFSRTNAWLTARGEAPIDWCG